MTAVRCRAPWDEFDILYDGRVKCCCWSEATLGSIHHQSIAEIWNGSRIARVREAMARGKLDGICPHWCPRLHDGHRSSEERPGHTDVYTENVIALNSNIGQTYSEARPIHFRTFPTRRCNLYCLMCGQDHRRGDELRPSMPPGLLEEYYPYIKTILAVGGEPLLSNDFRRMVRNFDFQRYPDCKFRVITNGMLFDEGLLQYIPGRFDEIGISIDSIQPQRFEYIRRGAKWAKVLTAIDCLSRLCGLDLHLYLLFTIMQVNYREIPDFVAFAREYGAIPSLNPVLETWHEQQLRDEQVPELIAILDGLDPAEVAHLEGCRSFYQPVSLVEPTTEEFRRGE